jgi:MFS family permease
MPASARGTGFGLLTTGSLSGLAISPIVSGLLGAISIRTVFLLDTIFLLVLSGLVRRLMVAAPLSATPVPTTEEV